MKETFEAIIEKIDQGDIEQALNDAEDLLKEGDDDTKRHVAELYFELGLVDKAKVIIEELMFRYPDHGELFAFAAECYIDLGEEDEAIEMLTEIAEDDPAYLQAQLLLADLYQSQGLEEVAEQKLQTAEKKAPDEPIIQYSLGEFYLSRGDYNKSVSYYKKVNHQKDASLPKELKPELRLAEAYSATGQFEEALDYYEQGLQKDEEPQGLFGYGYTAMQVEDYDLAIKQFHRLKEVDPSFTTVYPYLSRALRMKGMSEEALEVVKEGMNHDEFNEELYLEAGRIALAQGKAAEGEEHLRKVIALNPSNLEAVRELLFFLQEDEQHEEIEELIDFLEDYGEVDPLFSWYKAKAKYEQDEFDEAVALYDEISAHFEEDLQFVEEMAAICMEAGRIEEAKAKYRWVLKNDTDRHDIEEQLMRMEME
ncbi:tetratricopeptide repeat protein [Texcoconibacillus texcoconensis]|uniref:Tetratricopeptide (TPR) repeat protein n=1 Tax=Texcoconibacillus texcoconensis TaxID=1095777 RepID=A0A840QNB8_9BACI|nr:tetratricopeptide repeat protein [Texcoconibacillus texcoconensis]MBB5172876.1 tetratricopeptide (TPR) repeat protein [Texcoconibacillus texcoconensis]